MAKMRVMKKDVDEYKRLRNNYRSKIRRIRKKTGFNLDNIDKQLDLELPSIKEMKNGAFETRKQFKNTLNQMKRVLDRNFEPLQIKTNNKGLKYPEIIKQQAEESTKKAQDKADTIRNEIKDKTIISEGKEIATVKERELMLTDSEAYGVYRPSDFDINEYSNPKTVENTIKKNDERQSGEYYDKRMLQLQLNFLGQFIPNGEDGKPDLSYVKGKVTDDDPDNIVLAKFIMALLPQEFYDMYLRISKFDFALYDSDTGELVTGEEGSVLEYVIEDINTYYHEKAQGIDMRNIG